MLKNILLKSNCAKCKFCCSFKRTSLWETPIFTMDNANKFSKSNEYGVIANFKIIECNSIFKKDCCESFSAILNLENDYRTNDSDEEVCCPFLDKNKGCVLSEKDKPFDCSIWPLRVMKKNNDLVIALTPTCFFIGSKPSNELINLVKNNLKEIIYNYAKMHPCIIKEYKEGFPIIDCLKL